jgi:hypothetical protein
MIMLKVVFGVCCATFKNEICLDRMMKSKILQNDL